MVQHTREDRLAALAGIVAEILAEQDPLTFRLLEVGAASYDGQPEPFHRLVDQFPGSEVIAFEVDESLCGKLNQAARPGFRYFPVALGRREETRPFYQTAHPQCSSLYEPNQELFDLYVNLEVAEVRQVGEIETVSLDHFMAGNALETIDFIKIDIQGAELDVFRGGIDALGSVVMLISEVEFVPNYLDQPLFGDVCEFLAARQIMFHKFLGFGGRSLKPVVLGNNPSRPSQLLWADAIFIRDVQRLAELSVAQLCRLGVLAFLYGSPDVTYRCLELADDRSGSGGAEKFLALIAAN